MGFRRYLPFLSLTFAFLFARGIVFSILPLYFDSIGLSAFEIGVTFSLYGAGPLVFEILWGFLADRVNRVVFFPLIILMGLANFLLYASLKSFLDIALLQLMLGGSLAGAGVMSRLRMTELSEGHERGLVFGLLGSIFGLTVVLGSFVDSFLVNGSGYSLYFYVGAVIALVTFVPSIIISRGTSPAKSDPTGPSYGTSQGSPTSYVSRNLVLMSLVAIAITSSWGFFASLMPVILTKIAVHATASAAVLTVGIFNCGALIFQPLMGRFGSLRPRLWIALGLAMNVVAVLLLTIAGSVLSIYVLTFAAGACYAMVSPISLFLLMAGVPSRYFGRVLGFYGGAEDVGIIIGPFFASLLWSLIDLDWAFLSIAIILLVVLGVYLAFPVGSSHGLYESKNPT